ncbi:MAG TPA: SBBP repeat-containing protein [Rhizomicrobium sp.]|nr:SBBP repeat-containing protein [Rhizomicrobium sp.]
MTTTITSFDPSLLVNYYQAQINSNTTASAAKTSTTSTSSSTTNSATANDAPPWENLTPPSQQVQDAKVLSITNFLDTSNVPLTAGSTTDSKSEQDNQNLFSLYTAVNNLAYLASMAQRSTMTSGQLEGLNTRFQTGLQQVQSYLKSTTFNNFTLQAAATSSSVTGTATVALPSFSYTTKSLTSDANVSNALSGVGSNESFNINITKGGQTTSVPIDLSQVQGTLNLTNIVTYANQQLATAGFSTRLQKTITDGSIDDLSKASYGMTVAPGGGETVGFSSDNTQAALYLVGSSGSATGVATTTNSGTTTSAADQQGRIVKLTDLDTSPQSVFSATAAPSTGTTTAQASAVDSSGNIYVLGNATGNFGSQINQGSQDVYLTKYDSAGNVLWSQLVGSAGTASGYGLALDAKGNAYVTGSTTADLSTTAIADGNNDSFVAKYDSSGDQLWTQQIQTLNKNQSNAVSVDTTGNVYIGGQVTGVIGAGQTSSGSSDAYVAKLNSSGKVVYEQQFGTSGSDQVSAMMTAADGSLYVVSQQNGDAIVSKYANGDATSAPVWSTDLGALQNGGSIGGITVSGDQVYVSGTTQNGALTAGGAATVANASSGGTDAFVFNLTDNGTSNTPNYVSYVGTSSNDQAGAVTIGSDGTAYLAGTTTGTFAGNIRTVSNANNAFVASFGSGGSVNWVKQYGGQDGTSTGASVAIDADGASVLDALGLPTGNIDLNQSVDLTTATTLRAGDSFQIKIASGSSTRTTTISIDQGETLNSLTTKINAELGQFGKASTSYASTGEALKIAVNAGYTATLISGPTDSDALSRLGISPGIITNASTSSSASATSSSTTQGYGLGLTTNMDLSNSTDAGAARAQLLNVLSNIRNVYQKSNTPASSTSSSTSSTSSSSSSATSSYMTAQLANYNLALNMLTSLSSSSTSA